MTMTGMIAIIRPVAIMPTSSMLVAHEVQDAERQRALRVVGDQHDGVEELVPEQDEVEDHRGRDRRQRDRQADAPEDLPLGIAVHPRGVEQIGRDAREEALEDVDGERQLDRDVDERSSPDPVLYRPYCTRIWNSAMMVICGGKMIAEKMRK